MISVFLAVLGITGSFSLKINVEIKELLSFDICNISAANNETLSPPLMIDSLSGSGKCVPSINDRCNLSVVCEQVGKVEIVIIDSNGQLFTIEIISLFSRSRWETVFIVGVAVLLFVALFTMGCKLNTHNLWTHLKRPTNVLIGIFCQFVLMPLVSFGLALAATANVPEDAFFQLGIFACGIAPGGGASNIYTEIFEGNIDLSVIMTLASTIAAFATVPFWLATLGRKLATEYAFNVPLSRIATSLVTLLAPLLIGILVRKEKRDGR
ncbi:hypothetical protein ACOME3_002872 [Neoechinorhynchus agilis]